MNQFTRIDLVDYAGICRGKFYHKNILKSKKIEIADCFTHFLMNDSLLPDVSTKILPFIINQNKNKIRHFAEISDPDQQFKDSRLICKRAFEELSEKYDLTLAVGIEYEFFVESGNEKSESNNYQLNGMNSNLDINHPAYTLLSKNIDRLNDLGVNIRSFHKEYHANQYEVALNHEFGLHAADQAFYFRTTMKESGGKNVTFLPVFNDNHTGLYSSAHYNFSVWKLNKKKKYNEAEPDLDKHTYFLKGLLENTKALLPIFCPTKYCWNRLQQENNWAPSAIEAKRNSKETGYNICDNRIEVRYPSSCASPYLVVAAIIYCGIEQMESLENSEQVLATNLDDLQRNDYGGLPKNMEHSLKCFSENWMVSRRFSENFVDFYSKMIRANLEEFEKSENTVEKLKNYI